MLCSWLNGYRSLVQLLIWTDRKVFCVCFVFSQWTSSYDTRSFLEAFVFLPSLTSHLLTPLEDAELVLFQSFSVPPQLDRYQVFALLLWSLGRPISAFQSFSRRSRRRQNSMSATIQLGSSTEHNVWPQNGLKTPAELTWSITSQDFLV